MSDLIYFQNHLQLPGAFKLHLLGIRDSDLRGLPGQPLSSPAPPQGQKEPFIPLFSPEGLSSVGGLPCCHGYLALLTARSPPPLLWTAALAPLPPCSLPLPRVTCFVLRCLHSPPLPSHSHPPPTAAVQWQHRFTTWIDSVLGDPASSCFFREAFLPIMGSKWNDWICYLLRAALGPREVLGVIRLPDNLGNSWRGCGTDKD